MSPAGHTALVLSGGGARGAYQAGALQGLRELGIGASGPTPFDVLVGTSAGALNVGMMAAWADRWADGVDALSDLWKGLRPNMVFRTDVRSLSGLGAKWIKDLSFGGLTHRVAPKSLLDNAPLRQLLSRQVPFERLRHNVDRGTLHAAVVSAVDLGTANGVAFVDTAADTPLWRRQRWSIERTRLGVDHLLASSAIPVFFPSVPIGERWFGDGSVRNVNPLSPAINLGADRIVTIGVRRPSAPAARPPGAAGAPTIAEIAGVLLDAVMLDAIEMDVAHSRRVNRAVLACDSEGPDYPFSHVDLLWIAPSRDIGPIAADLEDRIPSAVRYLLRGLGTDEATTELASYLLFEAEFCRRLIELGRQDVLDRGDEVRAFFRPRSG